MGRIIVSFNHVHVTAHCDPVHLIYITNVVQHRRSCCHASCIGLEINIVYFIEPNERDKKAYIGFSEGIAHEVTMLLEDRINFIESFREII